MSCECVRFCNRGGLLFQRWPDARSRIIQQEAEGIKHTSKNNTPQIKFPRFIFRKDRAQPAAKLIELPHTQRHST